MKQGCVCHPAFANSLLNKPTKLKGREMKSAILLATALAVLSSPVFAQPNQRTIKTSPYFAGVVSAECPPRRIDEPLQDLKCDLSAITASKRLCKRLGYSFLASPVDLSEIRIETVPGNTFPIWSAPVNCTNDERNDEVLPVD